MRGMTPEALQAWERLRRRLYHLLEAEEQATPPPAESQWSPPAEIRANEEEVVLTLEVPGVQREEMDVNLVGSTLTVAGRRSLPEEERGRRFYQAERPVGRFSRSFTVPWTLDPEQATARLEDGVLTVRVRRASRGEEAGR